MKKIGFIDYFIDEWHANNYPRLIRESGMKDKFEVVLAWDMIEKEGRKPIDVWCREQNIGRASSIEQVVEESDCIVVLSPDNSEMHEELADLPLKSGKPVYIDKPIAPDLAAAKRLFEKAEKHKTPMMSSSALRFGSALEKAIRDIGKSPVNYAAVQGGGMFRNYAIHQIEMLVMLMGPGAKKVMQSGGKNSSLLIVDYGEGRRGTVNLMPGHGFRLSACYGENKCVIVNEMTDFFPRFVEAMLRFFDTEESPIPVNQTLETAALIGAGTKALETPDKWVLLEKQAWNRGRIGT
jgi:predicted dehydrogenase